MSAPTLDLSAATLDLKTHRIHRFAHKAMATVFEIFIQHDNGNYAQQAAHEAFQELDRLEQELSRFLPNSDITRINQLAPQETICLGEAAFACLQQSLLMHEATHGAFDITVGPLVDIWRNADKSPRTPTAPELEHARQRVGIHHFKLDEAQHTITLLNENPLGIDLGAFGKGYAVDQLAELLREWSITTALIHGGMSSLFAMGDPFATSHGWPIALNNPWQRAQRFATVHVRECALSGSGLQKGQHIIDPRNGRPAHGPRAAWAATSTAAHSDGISTAFMLMRAEDIATYCAAHVDTWAMLAAPEHEGELRAEQILQFGSVKGMRVSSAFDFQISKPL